MSKILDDFRNDVTLASSQQEIDYLKNIIWGKLSTRWGYNQLRRHHTAILNVINRAEKYAHSQRWSFAAYNALDCDQCKLYFGAWVRWEMKVDCKECT